LEQNKNIFERRVDGRLEAGIEVMFGGLGQACASEAAVTGQARPGRGDAGYSRIEVLVPPGAGLCWWLWNMMLLRQETTL
jgi:hypothetical protein